MTNDETLIASNSGSRPSLIHSSFVIGKPGRSFTRVTGHSSFRKAIGFTIMELLIVMTIIIILAALIIGTAGYVRKKAARSRAEAEIAAMSAACESYKADNGTYPTNADSYGLDARNTANPSAYPLASLYLYESLNGVTAASRSAAPTSKSYFTFKPNMLLPPPPSPADITAIRDPFGNSYGYSTAGNPDAVPSGGSASTGKGYNPTFDLWSTGGGTTNSPADTAQWIKNW
jgi:type II secretory pathway pseudopilin PulG